MNIQLTFILVAVTCLISACANIGAPKSMKDQRAELEQTQMLPTFNTPSTPVAKKTKDDFGVLEIKQDGPGYEINLALDTGDENVSFQMDLPEQSSASKKLAKQDSQPEKESDVTIEFEETPEQIEEDDFGTTQSKPVASETKQTPNKKEPTTETAPAIQQGPSANDFLVSAQTQFYEDNYMGALSDIEQAISQDDTQALSYAIKGSILYKLGNKQSAKMAWEQALRLNPKLASVELSLQYLVGQ